MTAMFRRWLGSGGMSDGEFWRLIGLLDWTKEGDDEAVLHPVVTALQEKSEQDVAEFQEILARKLYALDGRRWARESGPGIWWSEPGSLSVDGFLYARCVVVANGKAFYERVLTDPKAMPKDMEFESLLYVARNALKDKTGADDGFDTKVSFETFSNKGGWREQP
jgi:hypothetical protein